MLKNRTSVIFCTLIFFFCTGKLSGPATEEGNPVLAGTLFSDGNPAANAKVVIYRKISLPDSIMVASSAQVETWGTTDNSGNFALYGITPGEFAIEAVSNNETMFAFANNIIFSGDNKKITLDTIELSKPGTIKGIVTRGGVLASNSNTGKADGFINVLINEISREDITNLDGSYELTNVPAGVYTLVFYASDGFFTETKDSIIVTTGSTKTVDMVKLKRIPWLPPPKPFNLIIRYDSPGKTAHLEWSAYDNVNIIGYVVERRMNPLLTDTSFTVNIPKITDSLSKIPSGTTIYYVVRSVNDRFMESANEGPVSITIQ